MLVADILVNFAARLGVDLLELFLDLALSLKEVLVMTSGTLRLDTVILAGVQYYNLPMSLICFSATMLNLGSRRAQVVNRG